MKTTQKTETLKNFDAVKFVREQRNRLDAMFAKMTKEEVIAYFQNVQKTSTIRPSVH